VYTKAYLCALNRYPYGYINTFVRTLFGCAVGLLLLMYIAITTISYYVDFSVHSDLVRESIQGIVTSPVDNIFYNKFIPQLLRSAFG